MKLYYAPQACSLAPHIVLHELALPFELVRVNNTTKQTSDGEDFLTINPKGYVAALMLAQGEVLTEGTAILQYLAGLKPEMGLMPGEEGSWLRIRLQEWLSFISAEVHGKGAVLFNRQLPEAALVWFEQKLRQRLNYVSDHLQGRDYLLDGHYTIADIYLFTLLNWLPRFHMTLTDWPVLVRYVATIAARPAVQRAQSDEERNESLFLPNSLDQLKV